jgi:two-component system response regulator AtoC
VYLPATREGVDDGRKKAERFDGQGKTVLYVDDETHMRHLIGVTLEDAKYRVLVANGGMEALSYFRSGEMIHLLLTDLNMPMMDGLQLAQLLRDQRFYLPIVMITGQADLDVETLDPRPDVLLYKPIEPEKLLAALKTALRL